MTQRKALVIIDGQIQELPVTDSLTGTSGAGATSGSASLDFGTVPVCSKSFSFADALATTSSKILMTPVPIAASLDELEMDNFTCAAACFVNGTVNVVITALPGPVTGSRNFNYILG